jgi:putative FmdB family regulatory protein
MPLYEYRCEACEHQFEIIQKFSDAPIDVCPSCGQGPVVKLLSTPAIQFKGSGWYITDYARKGAGAPADGAGATSGKPEAADAGSAKATSETPAAKTESKHESANSPKKD